MNGQLILGHRRGTGSQVEPTLQATDVQGAKGFHERLLKGSAYSHSLADTLHGGCQDGIRTRELFKGETRNLGHLKNKAVVTYCTGGIRCEILTTVMKERGFNDVYQIEGGIVRYGEKYGDRGLWEGSLYTFDGRKTIDFSDETKLIGECDFCSQPTKHFVNCANDFCHRQYLVCDFCVKNPDNLACTHEDAKEKIK